MRGEVWTPLPCSTYREVARVLSSSDLADARVSARRALDAVIAGDETGVPEVWRGHAVALLCYFLELEDEWGVRGHRMTLREWTITRTAAQLNVSANVIEVQAHEDVLRVMGQLPDVPAGVQSDDRARLLARDAEWYGQWGWKERPLEVASVRGNVGQTARDELAGRRQKKDKEKRMATRQALVDDLRAKGYDGPVSYTKQRLEEMLQTVESGGTVAAPKRGRKPREAETNGGDAQEGD